MSEEAKVGCEFVGASGKACDGAENLDVEFSRVGLSADGEHLIKIEGRCDLFF